MTFGLDRTKRLRGFTLPELLVTIGIIAMLIGILLPTLAGVVTSAKNTVCKTRVQQIGIASINYAEAHKGIYPDARYMPSPFVSFFGTQTLPEALEDYFDAKIGDEAYHCPGDEGMVHSKAGISYAYLSLAAGADLGSEALIEYAGWSPSEIALLSDFDNGLFLMEGGEELDVPPFHGRRNFLFADGHVGHIEQDRRVSYDEVQ